MSDINEIRRKNLRKLVTEYEGMNSLARRLGLGRGAYISQLLSDPPVRRFGEKTARKWEKILGLADGWMDIPPGGSRVIPPSETQKMIEEIVKKVLDEVAARKLKFASSQIAGLIGMLYKDAEMTGGFNVAKLNQILDLIPKA